MLKYNLSEFDAHEKLFDVTDQDLHKSDRLVVASYRWELHAELGKKELCQ